MSIDDNANNQRNPKRVTIYIMHAAFCADVHFKTIIAILSGL
jgi:hypothetical protein